MAAGAVSAAPPIVAACKACHDVDGSGVGKPYVPIIAGIPPVHIVEALYAYKDGARQCVVEPAMCNTVALLSDQDIEELAAYYGKLPRFSHATTFNADYLRYALDGYLEGARENLLDEMKERIDQLDHEDVVALLHYYISY